MDLHKLYEGCRTYRRFKQEPVADKILKEIAETARTRSCAMNGQVLKFMVVSSPEAVKSIQPCLTWAAKLPKEIGTPKEGEQPPAFIILLEPEIPLPDQLTFRPFFRGYIPNSTIKEQLIMNCPHRIKFLI